jgi:hypothetical protein
MLSCAQFHTLAAVMTQGCRRSSAIDRLHGAPAWASQSLGAYIEHPIDKATFPTLVSSLCAPVSWGDY